MRDVQVGAPPFAAVRDALASKGLQGQLTSDRSRRKGISTAWEGEPMLPSTENVPPTNHEAARSSRRRSLSLAIVGKEKVTTIALKHGVVTIGRDPASGIVIDAPKISRRHALLRVSETVLLEDTNSANGVYVGPRRLEAGQPHVWREGEIVRLGDTRLLLLEDGLAAPGVVEVALSEPSTRRILLDPTMVRLDARARAFAASDIGVLLLGETGSGKEVFAETIHRHSPRANRVFAGLNCASLMETLLESELFGHERGAFTGATSAKPGLLEAANGGTVFLDEVGDMPPRVQAKLLRVLEQRSVLRVGGLVAKPIDVRFVSATNRDIVAEIERGTFRRDLYYRLSGTVLTIPPLRERPSEIEPLAHLFAERAAKALGRAQPPEISREALERLRGHSWPGNIRELRNAMEEAAILCGSGAITLEHCFAGQNGGASRPGTFEQVGSRQTPTGTPSASPLPDDFRSLERERILGAIERAAGNQTEAAKSLGISRAGLMRRLDAYRIPRPRKGTSSKGDSRH